MIEPSVTPPSKSSHLHFMYETQSGRVLCPKPGHLSVMHLGNFDLAVKTQTRLDFPSTPSVTQGPQNQHTVQVADGV